ncbi:hypothetical protein C1N53_06880 [Pontibacter sp. SGAir0037]|nr:hypothetical protein C1N53_06880 [Pontibacter sp. SGAir0037]
MPPHTKKTYGSFLPASFMPEALESPSGRFDSPTAITVTTLTAPPLMKPMPSTIDSGIPSTKAPTARASPLPASSCSEGCRPPDRFRCFAPFFASNQLAPEKITAPQKKPMAVAIKPPCS